MAQKLYFHSSSFSLAFLKYFSVDLLKALITAIILWLNSKLTHERPCQQLWPTTLAGEYLFFSLFYSWLQNVIDFVSFAISRPHYRQYCLIRLHDYSSGEWNKNGWEQWQCCRPFRNVAEYNWVLFCRNTEYRHDILLVERYQQTEVSFPVCVCEENINCIRFYAGNQLVFTLIHLITSYNETLGVSRSSENIQRTKLNSTSCFSEQQGSCCWFTFGCSFPCFITVICSMHISTVCAVKL